MSLGNLAKNPHIPALRTWFPLDWHSQERAAAARLSCNAEEHFYRDPDIPLIYCLLYKSIILILSHWQLAEERSLILWRVLLCHA